MIRKIFINNLLTQKKLSQYFFIYALINKIFLKGKKLKATSIVFNSFSLIKKNYKINPIYVYEIALLRIKPNMVFNLKNKTIDMQDILFFKSIKIAIIWLVESANEKKTKQKFYQKLFDEIIDSYNGKSISINKKEQFYLKLNKK